MGSTKPHALGCEESGGERDPGAFLAQREAVFGGPAAELLRALRLTDYKVSAFFRKGVYEELYDGEEPLLYGRPVVLFDVNWNVVGISRMIVTRGKLPVAAPPADAIDEDRARSLALNAHRPCAAGRVSVLRISRAVDAVRHQRVWDATVSDGSAACSVRVILSERGQVLNVSSMVDAAFTAKVNRWWYPNGDLTKPKQIVSTVRTLDSTRLEQTFLWVMNDHRCEGAPETMCTKTKGPLGIVVPTLWCEQAHGNTDGAASIRGVSSLSLDFSWTFPTGGSESFAETHTYYWARYFANWLAPALDALGALPDPVDDQSRVLLVTDTCDDRSRHISNRFTIAFSQMTTQDNTGEFSSVIKLADRRFLGLSTGNASCEGGACYDNPSNIHHELNHVFLDRYFEVDNDLDCDGANELKFTHEGILGTVVPQTFWDYYYGVGYAPAAARLYFSDSVVGLVYKGPGTLMTVGQHLCKQSTDDESAGPYRAGRVVGQALWQFYHGVVIPTPLVLMPRLQSSSDLLKLVYWAADLQAGSAWKDREEFANRVMEILDKYSTASSSTKAIYCAVFAQHQLADFINPDYCK